MVEVTLGGVAGGCDDSLDPHRFGNAAGGGIDGGGYSSYANCRDDDEFLESTLSMAQRARLAQIWVATRGSLRSYTTGSSYTIGCN